MEPLQLQDVVYTSGIVYYIKDNAIELFSNETAYGWKTVAELAKEYHYLDNELINIETAINLWQYLNNRMLSQSEIQTVMDNNLPRLGA